MNEDQAFRSDPAYWFSRRAVLRAVNLGFWATAGAALWPVALRAQEQGLSRDLSLDEPVVLVNVVSGRLLDAASGAAQIELRGRSNAPTRQWRISSTAEGKYLVSSLSQNMLLDAGGGNAGGGGSVRLSPGQPTPRCQWQINLVGEHRFIIRNAATGKLLDADSSTLGQDGTRVQLDGDSAEGMPSREWIVQRVSEYRENARPAHVFQDAPRFFDLLIITPAAFADMFSEYQAAKRNQGTQSHVIAFHADKTNAGGVFDDFSGHDGPERIKRAIEYAHGVHHVKYAMLVGDASLFPVRWRYIREADSPKIGKWAGWHDGTYRPADLYYASLYRHDSNGELVFDDWDANGKGRFNEQEWGVNAAVAYNPDRVDGYPDIAVGRIPAHNRDELQIYLKKVMAYEAALAHGPGRRVFGFVADQHYPGGDAFCDQVKSALPRGSASSTPSALLNALPTSPLRPGWVAGNETTLSQFAQSCFWISYMGHGAARAFLVPGGDFNHIKTINNDPNYPIVFAAACDTGAIAGNPPFGAYPDRAGQYRHFYYHPDASPDQQIDELDAKGALLRHVEKPLAVPPPNAFDFPAAHDRTLACAWLFNAEGGAIAYFGENVVCPDHLGRDVQKAVLANLRMRTLGDAWLAGQRKYHDDNRLSSDVFGAPRIFLSIMTCFGDPSLRLPTFS